MVTFGFKTFIQNPFLNNPDNFKVVVVLLESSIPEPSLKTTKAKYSR